mmetsp:Transcript_60212/g.97568  ORF Transcript_60212/g.97568 Transcript_60212/m.97568 type:complete len:112 (+) Transcript_60212:1288-1623(+)
MAVRSSAPPLSSHRPRGVVAKRGGWRMKIWDPPTRKREAQTQVRLTTTWLPLRWLKLTMQCGDVLQGTRLQVTAAPVFVVLATLAAGVLLRADINDEQVLPELESKDLTVQ